MVSFVCNHCQETLKKPKLDPHTYRCRNANFTCIDCNTDFHGVEYRSHTSCISEAEKYQKSLYKGPKNQKNNFSNQNSNNNKNSGKSSSFKFQDEDTVAPSSGDKRKIEVSEESSKKQASDKELDSNRKSSSSEESSEDFKELASSTLEKIFSEKPKIKFSKLTSKASKKINKGLKSKLPKDKIASMIEEEILNRIRSDKLSLTL